MKDTQATHSQDVHILSKHQQQPAPQILVIHPHVALMPNVITDSVLVFKIIVCVPQNDIVEKPCDPSPCGANAICSQRDNAGACSCLEGFYGNPYDGCRPECVHVAIEQNAEFKTIYQYAVALPAFRAILSFNVLKRKLRTCHHPILVIRHRVEAMLCVMREFAHVLLDILVTHIKAVDLNVVLTVNVLLLARAKEASA
ncbi:unnamed protein product, partial [Iphiclides podalirius]